MTLTFDGLDSQPQITQATGQAANYVATASSNQFSTTTDTLELRATANIPVIKFENTNGVPNATLTAGSVSTTLSSNQYSTTQTTLDLQANSLTPTFSLKNNISTTAGTQLSAGSVALTEPSTISSSEASPALTLTGSTTTAALSVTKSGGGTGAIIATSSSSSPGLLVQNNGATPGTILNVLAPSSGSTNRAKMILGRDTTNTGASYSLETSYTSAGSTANRLEVYQFNDSNPTIQLYKSAVTGTSTSSGSLVVNGDVGIQGSSSSRAMVLYGSTAGKITMTSPATVATPYTVSLPNAIGTTGQVLAIGTPSGASTDLVWTTPTGGGGSSSYTPQLLSRYSLTSQSITTATDVVVLFDTLDSVNSIGTTGLTYDNGTGIFTNGLTTSVSIYVAITLSYTSATSQTGYRQIWINQGGNKLAYNDVLANSADYTVLNISGQMTLAASGTFTIVTRHNQGSTLALGNTLTGRVTRIQISVLAPGSGMTGLTLNVPSFMSVTGSPTTGTTPTISVSASSTGTGAVVLANSPTLTTPTLNNPTITGTVISSTIQSTGSITANSIQTDLAILNLQTITLSGSFPTYNLSITDKTNILITGTFTGFGTIKLPAATTLEPGQVYWFNNNTVNTNFINDGSNSFLYNIGPGEYVQLYLITNSNAAGTWDVHGLVNPTAFKTTTTQIYATIPFYQTSTIQCLGSATFNDRIISNYDASSNPCLSLTHSGSTSTTIEKALAPSAPVGGYIQKMIGISESTQNAFISKFHYIGAGSASNFISNFFQNASSYSYRIYKNGITATSSAGTLLVDGGISSTSMYTGQITASTNSTSTFGSTSNTSGAVLNLVSANTDFIDAPLTITTLGSNTTCSIAAYNTNLPATGYNTIRFGQSPTNYNSGAIGFYYAGAASALNNIQTWLFGESTSSTEVYKNGITATSTAGTLKVNGGVTASSLYAPTVTTQALSITTNSNTFQYLSGYTSPTLYWNNELWTPFHATVYNGGTNTDFVWTLVGNILHFDLSYNGQTINNPDSFLNQIYININGVLNNYRPKCMQSSTYSQPNDQSIFTVYARMFPAL